LMPGCPPSEEESGSATSDGEAPEVLLEPFDPPSLEELNSSVEWEQMPVADTYEMYKEHLAGSEPLVSAEEALGLKNDSSEANEKILSALGRPPAADSDVGWDRAMSRAISRDIK